MEQVDDDDLKEMDIKWQVALLSMRAKSSGKGLEGKLPSMVMKLHVLTRRRWNVSTFISWDTLLENAKNPESQITDLLGTSKKRRRSHPWKNQRSC